MKRIYLQKAKNQIARPNTIRDINKQIVLNYVRERSPISRAEIARETELQRSTVSSIVDELQNAGLIEEIGIGTSSGGRKPTLLKLKTGKPVAIGVDLEPRQTTIGLADLSGKILEKIDFPTSPDSDFMSEEIIRRISQITGKKISEDLEIGISVPGITDPVHGTALYVPYFEWKDWKICKKITEKTGLRAMVENDANAIALAELWFGREKIRGISNFITVLVADGIGTGIIFEGQVYRGDRGAAGEFGHMIIGANAPVQCSCGSFDCWEALASEKSVVARYQNYSTNGHDMTMAKLITLARQGEASAVKSLQETAHYLGIGISNLIVGLSPQAVIVSGNITKAWDIVSQELLSIAERSVRRDLAAPSIIASTLGDQPTLMGALSLVLAGKFAAAVNS